uniref:Uncharacterized protein n=1 Tax=Romanomermis culicivorax TaxID=13658 RepID=A0A915J4Y5_ROMCU
MDRSRTTHNAQGVAENVVFKEKQSMILLLLYFPVFGLSRSFIYICKQLFFRKQLNRGVIIIFVSKRDIHFCIIDESSDRRTRRNCIIDPPHSPVPL